MFGHFFPPFTFFPDDLGSTQVAVCFFVLTSGFVTHWTSAATNIDGAVPLLGFYVRRLGRVLLTFWLAMLWAVYLLKRQGKDLPLDYVVTGR